ncbi:hypothetical protein BaRGS_00012988 [Batillaria attramentaria]|uniref:Uncharacterized protein n=1 Tax=Batillaria attramentaria TaxID=370345 RepID=A0ABD0L918_9CAEN
MSEPVWKTAEPTDLPLPGTYTSLWTLVDVPNFVSCAVRLQRPIQQTHPSYLPANKRRHRLQSLAKKISRSVATRNCQFLASLLDTRPVNALSRNWTLNSFCVV